MYALLVASDPDEKAIFSTILQRAGLAVTTDNSLEKAMKNWLERPADLVLVSLPQVPPQEQVRRIRAETQVPFILVYDNLSEQQHVELLRMGADLVMGYTFNFKLLIVQIGTILRRITGTSTITLPHLSAAGFTLNTATRTVDIEGETPKRLTHLEFRLLYLLMTNRGQVVQTETIVERVWGYTGEGDQGLVRGLISRLRNKVEPDPRKPYYIKTIPGIGYLFEEAD